MSNETKLTIIGAGPAGYTAAIYAARASLEPVLIEGSIPGGQLTTTTEVENFPGFSTGIMGPELMDEMRKQAERFGAKFVSGMVVKVDFSKNPFSISLDSGEIKSKVVIIATGAVSRTLGLAREKEMLGFGLSTCATCDGAFFRNQEIVVIGGGDSACEEALFLTKFGKRVRVILRRDQFRSSKIMAERVLKHPKIEVIYNHNLIDFIGDRQTTLHGAIIENVKSKERTKIECSAIFYALGHTPATELFKGILDMDENGYIITKPNSTKTNIEGVFACGDVQDHKFRQAITAAGSGCMAAIEAERFLGE